MTKSAWRITPLPRGWAKTRARILKRDNWTCRRCGALASTVDHVVPPWAGGSEDDSNLQVLCEPCHRTKTAREAASRRRQRKRQPEPHPGFIR